MPTPEEQKPIIETMAADLQAIRVALQALSKIGLNEELMVLYIQQKSGVGKTVIRAVLEGQKEFLNEAFRKR